MTSSKKKFLLLEIKKFLSKKKELENAIKPINKKPSKLQSKSSSSAIQKNTGIIRTISQVDHPGGSYDIVEYEDQEN